MSATRRIASPVALGIAAVALVGLAPLQVQGHAYMMEPVSRNFWATPAFVDSTYPDINYCPHCFQSRGPAMVRARGEENTDADELAQYGGGEWPHLTSYLRGELMDNGNYHEPEGISSRHGICGDPEQTKEEGSNLYGKENSLYPILQTYEEGSIMEVKVVFSTYHWGHLELFLCDSDELADPNGVVTQSCFNMNPLDRADDDGDASRIDPNHRGRYYVDPACRAEDGTDPTDQTKVEGATDGHVVTGRFKLPSGLTCSRCIVQMVYYTGNSCKHPGYDDFDPPSWPGSCAPESKDWIQTSLNTCGENGHYPEEFWNCADIEITSDGEPEQEIDFPTPAPVPVVEGPEPTWAPYPIPTPAPYAEIDVPGTPEFEEDTPAPTPQIADPFDNDDDDEVEAPDCEDPAEAYGQCGGTDSYDGPTCCVEDFECVELADCYSECRPVDLVPVDEDCSGEWGQCGGNDWQGPSCCERGSDCVVLNEWYHQCFPENINP
eukprot:g10338.t1